MGRIGGARALELLTERGLIKDKRAMPFVQLFKVRAKHVSVPRSFSLISFHFGLVWFDLMWAHIDI